MLIEKLQIDAAQKADLLLLKEKLRGHSEVQMAIGSHRRSIVFSQTVRDAERQLAVVEKILGALK